jgi:predicted metal-dependent peptidase
MKSTLPEILAFLQTGRGGGNPFFPTIINALKKIETPGMGTAGVSVTPEGKMVLRYDPQLVEDLEFRELQLVMIHEVYHLALNHIPRLMRLIEGHEGLELKRIMRVANIAMDYAVNSLMVQAKEATVQDFKTLGPEVDGKHKYAGVYPTDADLPPFQTFEWYFLRIMENLPQFVRVIIERRPGCAGEGEGEGSGGGGGGENEGENGEGSGDKTLRALEDYIKRNSPTSNLDDLEEALKEMTADQISDLANQVEREAKKAVGKAVEAARKSRGTVPGNLQESVNELLKDKEIPWQRLLSAWISNALRKDRERSKRRPKRRSMDDARMSAYPGKIGHDQYTLVYAIDTSGSMGGVELAEVMSELQNLQKAQRGIKIHVLEADTEIHHEYEVGFSDKPSFDIHGRGGTDFNCVFRRLKDGLKADALIYATDGYAPMPDLSLRLNIPVIWAITSRGRSPCTDTDQYGRTLLIKGKDQ